MVKITGGALFVAVAGQLREKNEQSTNERTGTPMFRATEARTQPPSRALPAAPTPLWPVCATIAPLCPRSTAIAHRRS